MLNNILYGNPDGKFTFESPKGAPRTKICFLGGNCPGGNCPGGNCPGGNCPGGNCLGGNRPINVNSNQQFHFLQTNTEPK